MEIRKILVHAETVHAEAGRSAEPPVVRVAAMAIVRNPMPQGFVADLSPLFEMGPELGELLVERIVASLPGPVASYGKSAVVGVAGDLEHGHAILHPRMGAPMRAAIGGGKALIPATVKVGGPGTTIDVPLGHKDDPWSFDHIDSMTVHPSDGPRPEEIVVIAAMATAGRPNARVPRL